VAGRLVYVDTSAFVKLVLGEAEASALRDELATWDGHVASRLLRTEAIGACSRYGSSYAELAREASDALALVPVDDAVLDAAAELAPAELRTLDALHLATALSLSNDLGAMVVYDARLSTAAKRAGLPRISSGDVASRERPTRARR
jgi:predicted nucleic acid-binding protein